MQVLDLSRVLAGPFCCQLLGDMGADIIKIEHPDGDETRGWAPPSLNGVSSYYRSCNRNKRLLTLRLDQPEGRAQFYDLVRTADVVVENFRPSSRVKLGVTPDELWAINPRLVIGSISAYGEADPERPGYDFLIQAQSGLMAITGEPDGPPAKVGVAVADVVTGLYLANGIQAALLRREQTGEGDHVECSLLGSMVASQINVAQAFLDTGLPARRYGAGHAQIVPYQRFATADGWFVLAIGNDQQWRRFCEATGQGAWAKDYPTNESRVRAREVLVPQLVQLLAQRTTGEWEFLCDDIGVAGGAVWDHATLFERYGDSLTLHAVDEEGRVSQFVRCPLRFAHWEPGKTRTPPALV